MGICSCLGTENWGPATGGFRNDELGTFYWVALMDLADLFCFFYIDSNLEGFGHLWLSGNGTLGTCDCGCLGTGNWGPGTGLTLIYTGLDNVELLNPYMDFKNLKC